MYILTYIPTEAIFLDCRVMRDTYECNTIPSLSGVAAVTPRFFSLLVTSAE